MTGQGNGGLRGKGLHLLPEQVYEARSADKNTAGKDDVKGLILLRKKIKAFRYQKAGSIKRGLRFLGERPSQNEPPASSPGDQDFSQLNRLKIVFKHDKSPKNAIKDKYWN